jgi:hypothetical protein
LTIQLRPKSLRVVARTTISPSSTVVCGSAPLVTWIVVFGAPIFTPHAASQQRLDDDHCGEVQEKRHGESCFEIVVGHRRIALPDEASDDTRRCIEGRPDLMRSDVAQVTFCGGARPKSALHSARPNPAASSSSSAGPRRISGCAGNGRFAGLRKRLEPFPSPWLAL